MPSSSFSDLIYSDTSIAEEGQALSQALHTTHSSLFLTVAFPLFIAYKLIGQVSTHVPHPVHFSLSIFMSTILSPMFGNI